MERLPEQDQDREGSAPAASVSEPSRAERDASPEPAREADLLSLALLVFFVALIGVVGALLLVPALF